MISLFELAKNMRYYLDFFHASVRCLCWFSTWNSDYSLETALTIDWDFVGKVIELAEYHLHLGYITCVFTFTPTLGFLQPGS